MNKKELAEKLAKRTGLSQVKALEVINEIFAAETGIIAEALEAGDKVLIAGFGTFSNRQRAARTGVNPGTGEKIAITAKHYAHFKPGTSLRDRLAK